MAIQCVSCGREIPAEDVNLATALAKCTGCDAVFGILDQVERPPGDFADASQRRVRGSVPMPKRFTVDDSGGELTIRFAWFSHTIWFLLVFSIFWDGFLVVWYVIAFATNGPLIMKLFPLLHVAVGLGLTWFVLATFLNQTTITVADGELRVRHGPVPWPGKRTLYSDDIDQVYVLQKVHTGKHGTTSHTWDVMAKLRDNERPKLVSGLQDVEQALFLEQEIERALRIADRPVPGEVPR